MASKAKLSLDKFIAKIERVIKESISPNRMKAIALEACELIRKRTQLGYSVSRNFGEKAKLKRLSERYIDYRQGFKGLSGLTTPGRSNLTLTGQMLSSIQPIKISEGKISIGPLGNRSDGLTNQEVAQMVSEKRPFNYLSALEFNQLLRIYRKQFGDLARSERLTFNLKL